MKTILDLINLGEDFLSKKGVDRPRREAEELIADALCLKRIDLYLNFERPLIDSELDICRSFFVRRGKKEPLQYISGKVAFAGALLEVCPDVLIPRPETEILVEKIKTELSLENLQGKVLLDMCTGSGCIGISLKKKFQDLEVLMSDNSLKAIAVAQKNSRLNQVEVTFLEGDLFAPLKERKIDFFVSNPPYISEAEYEDLSDEVRLFEPKCALVGGREGFEFYKRIAEELYFRLNEGGKGWLEIGYHQKETVLSLFKKNNWPTCEVLQDWSGHDRYLSLRK